ncbi:MAG: glycosyl hydrolase [Planctomycetaceae bacterium]|jgi:sialidase-1|nr:glycosyl hydrolase [Planctomycetaceae bacterium]
MRRALILATGCSLLLLCGRAADAEEFPVPVFEQQALFTSGAGGYHTYRIPSLIVTKRGTVLAFCEARKNDASDLGDVDLMLRRSADSGQTWSKPQLVHGDAEHTIGNPCPVVDRKSGTIWLPLCRDNKRVLMMKSTDDGLTWNQPNDITSDVMNPKWHWVGTGPGHGIQLASGRLLIPCWADATPKLGEIQLSYAFFSDDAGKSWKFGDAMDANASDECEAVELADGSIYMNMRSRQGKRQRASAISKDEGQTWSPVKFDARLPEPSVQGSVIRWTHAKEQVRNRVLLATPADPKARRRMTVRISYDECRTWPLSKVVDEGPAAYSDLAVAPDSGILLLYESHAYKRLTLVRFNHAWLTDYKEPPIKDGE